ncbi:MAG: hypothetical protein ACAH06_06455 [Methylophilaceae bacterium]
MTNSKPKKTKAAPGGAADATPLPISKSRAAVFEYIQSLPPDERAKVRQDIKAHPDNGAKDKLEAYLVSAHFDPVVLQSETLTTYVFLVRELLADFVPGMDLQQMLEPLFSLKGKSTGSAAAASVRDYRERTARANREKVAAMHAELSPTVGKKKIVDRIAVLVNLDPKTVREHLKALGLR